jgi:glycosyltransferase involved in cell wall biosynthesis
VPIYNGEQYVRPLLDMLAAQTYRDYELVIIDNASSDRTADLCAEYAQADSRIRYFRNDRTVTVVENFCKAFAASRGEFFLWQAADDARPPDAIQRALEGFRRHPEAVMVHGPVLLEVGHDRREEVVPNEMNLMSGNPFTRVAAFTRGIEHNAMIFGVYRRDALSRARFRQRLGQDYLVTLQVVSLGPVAYVDAPLICYRQPGSGGHGPMYGSSPLRLRDVAAYWGYRRYKCWSVLLRGAYYLVRVPRAPVMNRVRAALAHLVVFPQRHWRHFAKECVFLAATPLLIVRPLVQARASLRRRANARATG